MSERATAYRIAPQATAPAPGAELAVRPKVLRRPAHFNAKAAPLAGPGESAAPVLVSLPFQPVLPQPEKPVPAFRAWQDDGKFAITLLALVILVNLAVSAWLAAISPDKAIAPTAPVASVAAPAVHVLDTSARDISEQ